MLRQKENWELGLEEILEEKDKKVKDIYERMKTARSKKKKIELLTECKETLLKNIENPKLTLENQEQENYAKIKTSNMKMTSERRLPIRKTTSEKKTKSTSSPRKMTPTRKMTGKMTSSKTKNSHLTTSVARKLGLDRLPSVRKITERWQCTHLTSAQTEANFTSVKPVMISSSVVANPTVCTPVYRADRPMGGKQGQKTGFRAADKPIRAKD